MTLIYHVTINVTEKENVYHIEWANNGNVTHAFHQSATEIMPEEMEWMWKDRRNQLSIGRKLFRFLDGKEGCLQNLLEKADRRGQTPLIRLTACRETSNWPFELLAYNGTFLLPNRLDLVRSVSALEVAKDPPPQDRPLRLLFMACMPIDVREELDFEQEEEAIFRVTEQLAIDMEVEDTGSLEGLRQKLEKEQYDIVHLSGYADINKNGQPFFVMESETGYSQNVSAEQLWKEALCVNPPYVLFISGSMTGDTPQGTEGAFIMQLVETCQIRAALGWSQWVGSLEANEAAKVIYKDLSRGKSIIHAVQRARYELHNLFKSDLEPVWPQLKLFSSGDLLNSIIKKEQKRHPQVRRMIHVYLRNSAVKVLGEGFVGRRRQIQHSLWALKQAPEKIGLLILGTGGLGKSCLAGKVSERFKEHTLITVHGLFDSVSLKQALKDAFFVSEDDHGKRVLTWKMAMKEMLGVLCRSCLKDKKYLILLDDFEQNLEGAEQGAPGRLLPEAVELLKVLLDGLPATSKHTQIMITCRYGFSLKAAGSDLIIDRLEWIWLSGFRQLEQKKKVKKLSHIPQQKKSSAKAELLAAGCGNPRLMEWLDLLVGQLKTSGVTALLKAVDNKKEEFICKHVIDKLLNCGGKNLVLFLRWFAIYRKPVLIEGVKEIAIRSGLDGWPELLEKGMTLSLIEYDYKQRKYQGTPLMRERLLKEQDNVHACHEAAFKYYEKLCEEKPDDQFDPILVEEWVYHALECGHETIATHQGSKLVYYYREIFAFPKSLHLGFQVLGKKKRELSTQYDAGLLNELGSTMNETGDYQDSLQYLQEALTIHETMLMEKSPDLASVLNSLGTVWNELGNQPKAIEYYRKALAINEEILGHENRYVASVLNNIGGALKVSGDPRKAIDYFQRALDIWKTIFKDEHALIATGLNNLGWAWDELGNYHKAINYIQDALAIDKNLFGWNHPDVANRLNNLAGVFMNLGSPQKALGYYQEALSITQFHFGWEHPITATRLSNLGSVFIVTGEPDKSIEYFQLALDIHQSVYGDAHPDVAISLNNLGRAIAEAGEPRKAVEYFQKALSILNDIYGEMHPRVTAAINSLGNIWRLLGKPKKAVKYFQKSLSINEKAFGHKHPKVAGDLNNLGVAWSTMGKYRKAIDYYVDALTIRKALYGTTHPDIASDLNNLGEAWRVLGESERAIALYMNSMAILEEVFEREHPRVAKVLNNLGMAMHGRGEYQKAINYLQEAVIIYRKVYQREHPNLAITLSNLAESFACLDDYSKAIEYSRQSLSIMEKVYGKKHPDVATVLNNLGKAYHHLGNFPKAVKYYRKAIVINKAVYGRKNPDVATGLNNLGMVYMSQGDFYKAKKYFKDALITNKAIFDAEHSRITTGLTNLGMVCQEMGEFTKAFDYFKEAIDRNKLAFGDFHPSLSRDLNNMGLILQDLGKPREAITHYQEALKIDEVVCGKLHTNVSRDLNNLGSAWDDLGNHDKAIDYYRKALTIDEEVLGPNHLSVADGLNNLGFVVQKKGEPNEALYLFERALAISKSIHGPAHQSVATIFNNMGLAWHDLGEYTKAINLYEKALCIDEDVFGRNHPRVATDLNNIGTAWYARGDYRKATGYCQKALAMDETVFGRRHPNVARDLSNLGLVFSNSKKIEKAKDCFKEAYEIYVNFFGADHPDTKIVAGLLNRLK